MKEPVEPPHPHSRRYPGKVVLEHYEILDLIGHGAFAWVYRARSRAGEEVAVKILHSPDPVSGLRFAREIKVLKALPSTPDVVGYIDHGLTPDGLPLLVMEYVDGISLRTGMERVPRLEPKKAVAFMAELCHAFAGLHQLGVAHRDVKPENILLSRRGGIKLIDLGLIKDAQGLLELFERDDRLDQGLFLHEIDRRTVVGTPEYMAPEQFSDARIKDLSEARTDTWSDVFSLGVILYQLLSGRTPFPMADVPNEAFSQELRRYMTWRMSQTDETLPVCPEIDAPLNSILRVALSHDPRQRQADARALARDLLRYLETGQGISQTEYLRTAVGSPQEILELAARSAPAAPEPSPTSGSLRGPAGEARDDDVELDAPSSHPSHGDSSYRKRLTDVFFTPLEAAVAEPDESNRTLETDAPAHEAMSCDGDPTVPSLDTLVDHPRPEVDWRHEFTPTTPQITVDPASFSTTDRMRIDEESVEPADRAASPAATTERHMTTVWVEAEGKRDDDTEIEGSSEKSPSE